MKVARQDVDITVRIPLVHVASGFEVEVLDLLAQLEEALAQSDLVPSFEAALRDVR